MTHPTSDRYQIVRQHGKYETVLATTDDQEAAVQALNENMHKCEAGDYLLIYDRESCSWRGYST